MGPQRNWIAAFAWLFLAVTVTTAQREQDSHGNVVVKMEVLDLNNGLPGAGTTSVAAVGARFGKETTTEKDKSGKLLYLRTIDGQSRWLPDNAIEVKLDIKENGTKRTETIRLENFEPKTVLLRESRALGWRELLRLIPVFEPNERPCHTAG